MTRYRQVIADAGDAAVQQWENAVLADRYLANAEAWAYRVGAGNPSSAGNGKSSRV